MNLIKPMIIKMKNGAHTNASERARVVVGVSGSGAACDDVKSAKILISIYNPKNEGSVARSLARLSRRFSLLSEWDTLVVLFITWKSTNSFFDNPPRWNFYFFLLHTHSPTRLNILFFFFCDLSLGLSLIEHFSFWQWKKPFKVEKEGEESEWKMKRVNHFILSSFGGSLSWCARCCFFLLSVELSNNENLA